MKTQKLKRKLKKARLRAAKAKQITVKNQLKDHLCHNCKWGDNARVDWGTQWSDVFKAHSCLNPIKWREYHKRSSMHGYYSSPIPKEETCRLWSASPKLKT